MAIGEMKMSNDKEEGVNISVHKDVDEEDEMVMPGFRFHPTEEELVEFYLRRKVEGKRFNVDLITLDLYRYDPWELPGLAGIGEKEWYFYVPRDRKYRNGDRPNRVTRSGYWKATGADRMIRADSNSSRSIGLKKTLVFYSGKAPKGVRTSWIMNEYRLPHHDTQRYNKTEISLCRVYKRAGVDSLPRSNMQPQTMSRARLQQIETTTDSGSCSSSDHQYAVTITKHYNNSTTTLPPISTALGLAASFVEEQNGPANTNMLLQSKSSSVFTAASLISTNHNDIGVDDLHGLINLPSNDTSPLLQIDPLLLNTTHTIWDWNHPNRSSHHQYNPFN